MSRNPRFLSSMFKLYVRPHMEYCVEMWNPMFRGDIDKMERVQNKMTRLLRDSHLRSPESRNNLLGITTHKIRRLRGDLINIYKYIEKGQIFTLSEDGRTRGNDKKILRPTCQSTIKRHSFSFRSVDEWNKLPNSVVNCRTLNDFKCNVDMYLLNM